ncbi:MAG: hypothetical protein VXY22_02305 [Pseudomonadota bacterium]|nr:hypothetical protein [Pseudomonadota bacterium]
MCYEFNLVIIIAYIREARAIFDLNRFEEIKDAPFITFREHKILVIICGQGRLRAAAAVSFAKTLCEYKLIFWLNIGAAGHRNLSIGTVVQAGKIYDLETDRSWFPSTPFKKNIAAVEINTCDIPIENYPKDVCYDMEASGFIELAQIDSIPEQLAVVKVITDNHSNPFRHQSINELEMSMRKKKNTVTTLVADYMAQAAVIADSIKPIILPWWLRTIKFTATQRNEVKHLINNYRVQSKEQRLPFLKISKTASTRDVLNQLRQVWSGGNT